MKRIESSTKASSGCPGPGEAARDFARALLARDPGAAASFLSPVAQFLTADGTEVSGRASIADLLAQLTTREQRLEIRTGRTIRADTVAIATQYWKRTSPSEGTRPFELETTARLVLREEDGRWLIAIAIPWS